MHLERNVSNVNGYIWRNIRRCWASCSLWTNTFFQNSKFIFLQILIVIYYWCQDMKQVKVQVNTYISANVMVDLYNFCRDICVKVIQSQDVQKIKGVVKIVEIDESKFSKLRKYNREVQKENQWIFGGMKQGNIEHMFLEAMANRKKKTLTDLIYRHIESGTTIISDCWSAYDTIWLNQLGFTHVTMNYSRFFKDPIMVLTPIR